MQKGVNRKERINPTQWGRRLGILVGLAVVVIVTIVLGVTVSSNHRKKSSNGEEGTMDMVDLEQTRDPVVPTSLRPTTMPTLSPFFDPTNGSAATLTENPIEAPTENPTLPPLSDPANEPTNMPAETSSGSVWAMEETFDGDPDSPSQDLLPRSFEYVVTHRTHPKEHFTLVLGPYVADHDENCNGPDPNAFPLAQHPVFSSQDTSSSNPDSSFYICKNHMMTSMGDVIGYSVSAFWPRQEFVVGRSGAVLEFDVNLNDGHAVRSWWEILITPRDQLRVGAGPVDSPISETYPQDRIVLDFRRNVRAIRIGTGAVAPDGWMLEEKHFGPYDFAYWRSLHPTDPANDDRRVRRKMRIEFGSNVTWSIETKDGTFDEWTVPLSSPLPFENGLVLFKTHAYTPEKDGNFDAYTFHWDNIRFSGPVRGKYQTYEASDVVYLQRNGDRPIGDNATVSIELPAITTIQTPILFGQVHHPIRGQVLLSINDGSNIQVHPNEYEKDDCVSVDWNSFRLPLDVSVLVEGTNTFQWTVGSRPDCLVDDWEWNGFSVKFLHLQAAL